MARNAKLSGYPQVEASVVVPVRDRSVMLGELLEKLDQQTFREFEVIVVDDGSTDGSGELARAATVAGRPVRVLEASGEGAVVARVLGVANALGNVIAFTDSDCLPDPKWLENALSAFSDGAEVVNGFTRPTRELRPFERSMASGTEGLYPTCNMFIRKDLFERIGGFDTAAADRWRFRLTGRARGLGFGEDTLLGWRAIRGGADVRYVEDAVVEHQVFPPDLKDTLSRLLQVAAFPAMVKELPELRGTLMEANMFLGDYTRLPLYLAAASLFARRRNLALFAASWWVASKIETLRRSPYPTAEQLVWLPAELAGDVFFAAALLAGSVRARSLVL
jgi:glycosyltransferase involved in cell wall biosynthesis